MEGQDEMVNLIAEIGQQDIRQTFGGIHFHGSMSMVEAYGGGGEEMMDTWCVFGDGSGRGVFNTVVAMDNCYHYGSKGAFFEHCARCVLYLYKPSPLQTSLTLNRP